MLLHASHAAAAGYKAVIITSEDTDVFVLSLAFKGFIPCSVFVKCGQDSNNIHRPWMAGLQRDAKRRALM